MNNTLRWSLFGLVIAVNIAVSVLFDGTWYGIVVNVVSGLIAIGLVLDYLVRVRER
ncbi:hypothetical protein [Actinocorallia populi]|uniref:hypothetical protein n=1 Tax=Actinocorallia populi TaxID=2079200 RepID=UPI0013001A8B|nr:hypothetical protein [Actinocorallia populi]